MVRWGKSILMIFAIAVIVAVTASPRIQGGTRGEMPDTYSIKTFLEPDWELAMHEIFTHYLQSAATFGQGDYGMCISFLKVMGYYINMLPDIVPSKLPDGRRVDRAKFLQKINQLRTNTRNLRRMIEKKEYSKATKLAPDYVTSLCRDCHKNAKVPPKWRIGGYKVNE